VIGRRLGDYNLVGLLATGGMARIYEGVDARLGRHVAVKVLELEADLDNPDDTLPVRFEREARAVAKLDHPNIISIYQYGDFQGSLFIVMPLIRGRDLAQEFAALRKTGKRMDVRRGLRLLEQIASALDYAHSAGVIHRDVKPSNILIDGNDRAILTDFGLVFQPKEDPTLGTAFGTPRYIAPEQAVASDQATAKSDLYSLAVILYEMLTGQTPFNGVSAMEIALAHINDAPPSPRSINPEIPEAADLAIMQALSKDQANRQATALELIQSIKAAYDPAGAAETKISAPTVAYSAWDDEPETEVGIAEDEAEPPRRSPLLRLVLLLVVIAVVSVELLSLLSSAPPAENAAEPTLIIADADIDFVPAHISYSATEFNLVNTSSAPIDIRGVEFAGGNVTLNLSAFNRAALPPGMCIRILLEGRASPPPEGCREVLTQSVLADAARFFWTAADGFSVTRGGIVAASCPAAQRSRNVTCSVALPVIVDPGV
jgi:serine/threonine protein kinase